VQWWAAGGIRFSFCKELEMALYFIF
jgi:hypothetical protein